jgi:hypothetical protein
MTVLNISRNSISISMSISVSISMFIVIAMLLQIPIPFQIFIQQDGCEPELKIGMVIFYISNIDQLIIRDFRNSMIK